ncbi:MAG: hypothetical protein ACTHOB_09815 [Ginsengibacter sp.]
MYKVSILVFLFLSIQKFSFAQDTLPKITVTQLGKRVLISWNNPFSNVANINIQRSYDSLKNFKTIGSVLNVGPGVNGFTDSKEFILSDQYYRLFISFNGGTYLFTHSHRPGKDTLANVPKIINQATAPVPQAGKNLFIPSKHIFTGKDNNVIIALPNAMHKKYSIKFYDQDGTFLFELKKINQDYLTLDKSNFLHSGLFIFELFDDRIIIERHKFFIPKDGKPMPALDSSGNPIR